MTPRARVSRLEVAAWFAGVLVLTAGLVPVRTRLNDAYIILAYLLLVQLGSSRGGRILGVALSAFSFLCFNFFLLPPYYTLRLEDPLDWLVLVAFFVTSLVAAQLLSRAQSETEKARQRTEEVDRLASLGAETLNAARATDALGSIVEVIRRTLDLDSCMVFTVDSPQESARVLAQSPLSEEDRGISTAASLAAWVAANREVAGERMDGTATLGMVAPTSNGHPARGGSTTEVRALLRPLVVRGHAVGVLRIRRASGLSLDAAKWRILDALSYYAALGVERMRLTAEAERAHELQEAHRAKDAVIASVSHDLRTPLTTIKGLAHDLAEGGDERAAHIEEEADRLNRLVADLLDLSRINSGAVALDLQPNDAEDLVGAAARSARGLLEGRELRIGLEPSHALLFGRFDFAQTLRALVNLIENAAKYSPAGSAIELAVRHDGATLCFEVADRGPGVPLAERERVFEPFHRRPVGDAVQSGAGLGLAIARSLVEAQGGSLMYRDRDGGGSVFTIRVPAVDTPEPQIPAE